MLVLYLKAPAKINLALDVLDQRIDGYHEVEMVMTTIDLFDRVGLRLLPDEQIKVCTASRFVPNDQRNLAIQAAYLLKERFSIAGGVEIHLDKQIPVSAGLGGGSSDAAAVLLGLNNLWSLDLSLEELICFGSEIGTDVPFCIYGKTAIARGRGELIEPLPSPPASWVVLAKPDLGISSRNVFEAFRLESSRNPSFAAVVTAIVQQDFTQLCASVGNALESVTFSKYPEVRVLSERIAELGAEGVSMTGSGPTIYGLVREETKAWRIYNGLRGFCEQVYVVRLLGK